MDISTDIAIAFWVITGLVAVASLVHGVQLLKEHRKNKADRLREILWPPTMAERLASDTPLNTEPVWVLEPSPTSPVTLPVLEPPKKQKRIAPKRS